MWQTTPELIATAAVMQIILIGALVGLAADPRMITGAPAWLKPAKFAVSITIYTVTLAWIFTLLPEWTRTRRVVGWMTAITMLIEIAIIGGQAWRGTTSHFNVGTVLDGVLFTIMGLAIVIQTISTIAVAVALWRHRFEDSAMGWALRFGMVITIVGALTGGLMTRPTSAQLEAARAGERMTIAGAHTVGAADGGPGLIGTGWSTGHGDLRVPHFVGLHALQALPLVALVLGRLRITQKARQRLVLAAAASYTGLYVILLTQALRGIPLIARYATEM
jgi:energy-converting hydrogenase Eha subunit F